MLASLPARLRRATAPVLVAAAAVALTASAPAWAVSDTTTAGSSGVTTFHPFTIPSDGGCVLLATDGSYNCDPVNVVFPGRSPTQVRDLLRNHGWTTFDFGSTQRLHFTTSTLYSQDIQVFRPDGRNSAGQSLRYHVRLWRVRGTVATVTVGAVHHEARVSLFSDRIDKSWEESEEFLRGQLCAPAACPENPTLTTQSGMQGPNPTTGEPGVWWRGWYNDARPTVIP
jgi:hypothetical protein